MRLYIDDIRDPKGDGFDVVRSSVEAIDYMSLAGCPEFISFDHDLGGDDTAMIIVKWMVDTDLDCDGEFIPKDFEFFVHSANPVGVANIHSFLESYLSFRQSGQI